MILDAENLEGDLSELERENAQGYGYLGQYWNDAKVGLDNTSRNYVPVKHIYENIPDPKGSTRALGKTLTALTTLRVIRIYTHRSNATIYDLTSYSPDRLAELGRLLNAQ